MRGNSCTEDILEEKAKEMEIDMLSQNIDQLKKMREYIEIG